MNEIKNISLDNLYLDPKNPRIYQDIADGITQINLAKFIYDEFGIRDLKDSLLKNGYFIVEPMVVIPRDEADQYTVVEGNRRLTTIKILCKREYREAIVSLGRREDFEAPKEVREKLLTIPVVIAEDRDSINTYLGVRHLEGIVKWEPLAQSKYVYTQILDESSRSGISIKESMDKFVKMTNAKPAAGNRKVRNFFYKYCIYQSMQRLIDEDKTLKDASLDHKFSLLEVAMNMTGTTAVANYIGIESYSSLDPEEYENIIPEENEPQAKNIIRWVFSKNPAIKESREINKYLKPILKNPESTKAFEQGEDKDTALLLSDTYDNIVESYCRTIHKSLTKIENYWTYTTIDNRENLKKSYKVHVVNKVENTNKTLDL